VVFSPRSRAFSQVEGEHNGRTQQEGARQRLLRADQRAGPVVGASEIEIAADSQVAWEVRTNATVRHAMFDGPTTLTLMAAGTTSIRVGTLVSSLYFRHPVTLTKAAMTLDHLSGAPVGLQWPNRCVSQRYNPKSDRPVFGAPMWNGPLTSTSCGTTRTVCLTDL